MAPGRHLREVTRLIIEKLLLTPTEQLKSLPDNETMATYADALTRLFSLAPGNGSGRGEAPPPADGDPASLPDTKRAKSG